jgi:hypothetical protein
MVKLNDIHRNIIRKIKKERGNKGNKVFTMPQSCWFHPQEIPRERHVPGIDLFHCKEAQLRIP